MRWTPRPAFPALVALFLAWGGSPALLGAQEAEDGEEEPLAAQLRERVKSPAFSLGVLFQFRGDFQRERTFPGENGFSVPQARVSLSGRLDRGIGYFFQTNFGRILDLRVSYTAHPALSLEGGLFKTPYSGSFLVSTSDLDLVDRFQGVGALVPGRQVGAQLRGEVLEGGPLEYRVGIFNGNGTRVEGNDTEDFMYGGRLLFRIPGPGEGDGLELGVNAFRDDQSPEARGVPGGVRFEGFDRLVGADLRFTRGRALLSGEVLQGAMDLAQDAAPRPAGYHVTAGYRFLSRHQALVRWDSFSTDLVLTEGADRLVLGYNYWPTEVGKVQVNLVLPTDDGEDPRLLVNTQISF